jgi:uncharacterized repeat protein (TIGR01451 family)
MTRLFARLSAAAIVCAAVLASASPARAAGTVPFKVYVTELWQLDDGIDPGLGRIGDFYARVTINNQTQENKGACDDETSAGILVPLQIFKNFGHISDCKRTPWVFTQNVDPSQPVHVTIAIFDEDLAFDDQMDAKSGAGEALNLTIDPVSGKWSGDLNWPQTCSRPDLPLGGNRVNVCVQASLDTDDDGLLDVWERYGVDTDNDAAIDVNLPAMGADPLHKDAFVEIDWLQEPNHTHAPTAAALQAAVAAFANSTNENPDGSTGIQLHLDVGTLFGNIVIVVGNGLVHGSYGNLGGGNAIVAPQDEVIEAFDKQNTGKITFADVKTVNFDPLRETIFRYTIFGHQTNARADTRDCTSGQSAANGRDFMVTLGGVGSSGPCWGFDDNGFSVGTDVQQAGTLLHELGHSLGLRHGGGDDVNAKPNYLSVMNYAFQMCTVPTGPGVPGLCDYSRTVNGELPLTLNETNLDECVGIGLGFGPRDWNQNGPLEGVSLCNPAKPDNVFADVNDDGVCATAGSDGVLQTVPVGDDFITGNTIHDGPNRSCTDQKLSGSDDDVVPYGNTPPQPSVLAAFDDWSRVNLSLIDVAAVSATGDFDVFQEATPEIIRALTTNFSAATAPSIALSETGPATARPGDVLSYTITGSNSGHGPALASVLQTRNPDGAVATSDVGIVTVGSAFTRSTSFTVPVSACPGDLNGAGAALVYRDFAGVTHTASTALPLQIVDVAAPTVTVTLSPSAIWPPNHQMEPVTATVTATDNCDPQPTVTLVSITSNEPAEGFLGQGDRGPDVEGAAFGTDDRAFSVRAERGTGHGSTGRVYTVTYRVTDRSGNSTVSTATVTVPANNGGK